MEKTFEKSTHDIFNTLSPFNTFWNARTLQWCTPSRNSIGNTIGHWHWPGVFEIVFTIRSSFHLNFSFVFAPVTWNKVDTKNEAILVYDRRAIQSSSRAIKLKGQVNWGLAPFISSRNAILVDLEREGALEVGNGFHVTVEITGEQKNSSLQLTLINIGN